MIKMTDAAETARLARASSFDEAVSLIYAFADREANAAVVRAVQDSQRSVMAVLNASLGSPLVRGQRKQEGV